MFGNIAKLIANELPIGKQTHTHPRFHFIRSSKKLIFKITWQFKLQPPELNSERFANKQQNETAMFQNSCTFDSFGFELNAKCTANETYTMQYKAIDRTVSACTFVCENRMPAIAFDTVQMFWVFAISRASRAVCHSTHRPIYLKMQNKKCQWEKMNTNTHIRNHQNANVQNT